MLNVAQFIVLHHRLMAMDVASERGVLVVAWAWPEDLPEVLPSDWLNMFYNRSDSDEQMYIALLVCSMRNEDCDEDSCAYLASRWRR